MPRRSKSGALVKVLEAWGKTLRDASASDAISRLSNFNEWEEEHWKRHQERLVHAIMEDQLVVHEQLRGKWIGRVQVTIAGNRDGVCFVRDQQSWCILKSVFDWTSLSFNDLTEERQFEIQQLNGELMVWQAELLDDPGAQAFVSLLGRAAAGSDSLI